MRQYYYTVCVLPHLSYDSPPPFPTDELKKFLQTQIVPGDFKIIQNCSIQCEKIPIPVSIALQKWYTWEISLRNELVRLRSRVKKRDGEKYLKPVPDSEEVKAIANTAFSQDNPLAAETVLSRARWTVLDECEAGHHFDMDKLTVYTLKLLLLERKASLDRENGIEKYNRIMKQFDESFESREKALWKK